MNIILSWNILLLSLSVLNLDNSTTSRTMRELRASVERRKTRIAGIFTYYY